MFFEILKIAGLGFLGILLYAFVSVWKKIKTYGFSSKKFFNDNVPFWAVCIALNIIFAVVIVVAPDFGDVLKFFGLAIESDNLGGFILLGVALAAGSDKTKISGSKNLNTSAEETTNPTKPGGGKT